MQYCYFDIQNYFDPDFQTPLLSKQEDSEICNKLAVLRINLSHSSKIFDAISALQTIKSKMHLCSISKNNLKQVLQVLQLMNLSKINHKI